VIDQKANLPLVKVYVARLRKHFGNNKAVTITTDRIRAYIAARQAEKN
jgi:hypothetical protein